MMNRLTGLLNGTVNKLEINTNVNKHRTYTKYVTHFITIL